MKYVLFIDVQKSNINSPAAQTVAKRIIDCAYQIKGREGFYTFATRFGSSNAEADGEDGELFSCLGSLVNTRANRLTMLSTFPALTRKMAENGTPPEEIYVCGFEASGVVLFAAMLFKSIHPTAKVTIIDDLSFDSSYTDKLAALEIADRLGVHFATAENALGIKFTSADGDSANA